jgi:hypothetical protein
MSLFITREPLFVLLPSLPAAPAGPFRRPVWVLIKAVHHDDPYYVGFQTEMFGSSVCMVSSVPVTTPSFAIPRSESACIVFASRIQDGHRGVQITFVQELPWRTVFDLELVTPLDI